MSAVLLTDEQLDQQVDALNPHLVAMVAALKGIVAADAHRAVKAAVTMQLVHALLTAAALMPDGAPPEAEVLAIITTVSGSLAAGPGEAQPPIFVGGE